ncbi:MAG: archaeosortase/exosortase family protein [Candidatus Bathyarchaeota archaeon]|nr:MAG: archaeosortase/exosortase family protein [Candidatus Bathyarchaeota archaeon]
MPLSVEYIVFAVLFVIIITLAVGYGGLKEYSITAFFLWAIGTIYTIDSLFPYGSFTPFQIFVPVTASLAANVLSFLGYQATLGLPSEGMPLLTAANQNGSASFYVAWPCSGIQSLIIYTLVVLLFFRKTTISPIARITFFMIGSVATYCVNILRIATIFVIQINQGEIAAEIFHNYYGELYSMAWIMAYPLIIMSSYLLHSHVKHRLESKVL